MLSLFPFRSPGISLEVFPLCPAASSAPVMSVPSRIFLMGSSFLWQKSCFLHAQGRATLCVTEDRKGDSKGRSSEFPPCTLLLSQVLFECPCLCAETPEHLSGTCSTPKACPPCPRQQEPSHHTTQRWRHEHTILWVPHEWARSPLGWAPLTAIPWDL